MIVISKKNRQAYTESDLTDIIRMCMDGKSYQEMASKHNRFPGSLKQKICALGLEYKHKPDRSIQFRDKDFGKMVKPATAKIIHKNNKPVKYEDDPMAKGNAYMQSWRPWG